MEEILKYLNESGFVEATKHAVKVAPKLFGKVDEKTVTNGVRTCLLEAIKKDDELQNLVFDYCIDLSLDNIVKSLNIKCDAEDVEVTTEDYLAGILALLTRL